MKSRAMKFDLSKIAEEAKAAKAHEAKTSKVDEAKEPQVHEAAEMAPEEAGSTAVRVPRLKVPRIERERETGKIVTKTSTSLYLSGAAHRELRKMAAEAGVRPHRIVDEALRAYFKKRNLDFDKLNATN